LFCDLHKKHPSTLGGQNVEFLHVKAGGIFSNRRTLKG